jgi:S-DNA-T family DNA segregation ATPase FtsK/SpoIIIE
VIASTQKPSHDIIPTSLRDLVGIRLAMRCTSPDQSDTILGKGYAGEGFSASRIRPDKDSRGEGLLLADDSIPQRIKCFYLNDDAIRRLVLSASHQREAVAR